MYLYQPRSPRPVGLNPCVPGASAFLRPKKLLPPSLAPYSQATLNRSVPSMPSPCFALLTLAQPTRAPLARSIGRSAARHASLPRHRHRGASLAAPVPRIPKPPAIQNTRRASRIARPSRHAPRPADRCDPPASRCASPASHFSLRAKFTHLARAPTWFVRKPPSLARNAFRDKCKAKSLACKAPAPCARTFLVCAQSKTTCVQSFEPCAQAKKPCGPSSVLRAPLMSSQARNPTSLARPSKPLCRSLNLRVCSLPCHHAGSALRACSPGTDARRQSPR